MNKATEDKTLKAQFEQLRETETRAAPSFSPSGNSTKVVRPRPPLRPAWQFALAALLLVVAGTLLLDRSQEVSVDELAETAPAATEDLAQLAPLERFEMPTDFLLDTPWYDLASTTPNFDFDDSLYMIPEELSDEA